MAASPTSSAPPFDSSEDLETSLRRHDWLYNRHIPQCALGYKTPIETLQTWQKKKPELLVSKVTNHAVLTIHISGWQPQSEAAWLTVVWL